MDKIRDRGERDARRMSSPVRWILAVTIFGLLLWGEYTRTFEAFSNYRGNWAPSPAMQAVLAGLILLPVTWLASFASGFSSRMIGSSVLVAGASFHVLNGSNLPVAFASVGVAALVLLVAATPVRSVTPPP